mgnify:CR=1 FL=1
MTLHRTRSAIARACAAALLAAGAVPALADETCNSPYMARLLTNAAITDITGPRFDLLLMRALEHQRTQRALQFRRADDLYNRFAPPDTGMPYLVFLDTSGATVATSTAMGGNVGYPTETWELNGFEAMLRTVAPDVTAAQLAHARRACIELAPRA